MADKTIIKALITDQEKAIDMLAKGARLSDPAQFFEKYCQMTEECEEDYRRAMLIVLWFHDYAPTSREYVRIFDLLVACGDYELIAEAAGKGFIIPGDCIVQPAYDIELPVISYLLKHGCKPARKHIILGLEALRDGCIEHELKYRDAVLYAKEYVKKFNISESEMRQIRWDAGWDAYKQARPVSQPRPLVIEHEPAHIQDSPLDPCN